MAKCFRTQVTLIDDIHDAVSPRGCHEGTGKQQNGSAHCEFALAMLNHSLARRCGKSRAWLEVHTVLGLHCYVPCYPTKDGLKV